MDVISRWIADFILLIGQQTQIFWENLVLLNFSWPQIVLDIVLVAIIFYYTFALIKGSRAVHVLIGLCIILAIYLFSKTLQLVALSWLLDKLFTVVLIAIPIIFQRELRMGLERLGHTKLFLRQKARQIDRMIMNIVNACESMSKDNVGALIVIQNTTPLKEYIDTGIPVNATVSKELIVSIFFPKLPLHDGAVIIADETIKAASCILPNSLETSSHDMGTRHKAALGLAENTDAGVIVVSEERGTISYAKDGKIERNISPQKLLVLLTSLLRPNKTSRKRTKK